MNLKDLTIIPAYFNERQINVRKIIVLPIDVVFHEFDVSILFKASDYNQEISFRKKIHPDSNIKIFCSCPSFNFEFANILHKNNALLYPEKFTKAITRTPRVRNIKSVLTGCKHCIACGRFINNNLEKIDEMIKRKELQKNLE